MTSKPRPRPSRPHPGPVGGLDTRLDEVRNDISAITRRLDRQAKSENRKSRRRRIVAWLILTVFLALCTACIAVAVDASRSAPDENGGSVELLTSYGNALNSGMAQDEPATGVVVSRSGERTTVELYLTPKTTPATVRWTLVLLGSARLHDVQAAQGGEILNSRAVCRSGSGVNQHPLQLPCQVISGSVKVTQRRTARAALGGCDPSAPVFRDSFLAGARTADVYIDGVAGGSDIRRFSGSVAGPSLVQPPDLVSDGLYPDRAQVGTIVPLRGCETTQIPSGYSLDAASPGQSFQTSNQVFFALGQPGGTSSRFVSADRDLALNLGVVGAGLFFAVAASFIPAIVEPRG